MNKVSFSSNILNLAIPEIVTPRYFVKKMFLKISQNSQEKTIDEVLLNKVADLS